ncbi:hypothetical protein A2U01_0039462 [Trifolium medium]|uniref:Uncharacterized protein n=1 Tax=Trifolium medium TaxID=97028 RepID=A0A392Q2J9_9FABA|nr:hypothetical protein [Trifolium medium]
MNLGMVRPKFEAESGSGNLMSPGDSLSRQARCCFANLARFRQQA